MLNVIESSARADGSAQAAVVTKAAVNAADRLGVNARLFATVLGVSEASVSRMKRADYRLEPATKPFELALLFIRLFRSLDAIAGGDETVARQWLRHQNTALGGVPAEKIATISGLTDVLAYLDARRALV